MSSGPPVLVSVHRDPSHLLPALSTPRTHSDDVDLQSPSVGSENGNKPSCDSDSSDSEDMMWEYNCEGSIHDTCPKWCFIVDPPPHDPSHPNNPNAGHYNLRNSNSEIHGSSAPSLSPSPLSVVTQRSDNASEAHISALDSDPVPPSVICHLKSTGETERSDADRHLNQEDPGEGSENVNTQDECLLDISELRLKPPPYSPLAPHPPPGSASSPQDSDPSLSLLPRWVGVAYSELNPTGTGSSPKQHQSSLTSQEFKQTQGGVTSQLQIPSGVGPGVAGSGPPLFVNSRFHSLFGLLSPTNVLTLFNALLCECVAQLELTPQAIARNHPGGRVGVHARAQEPAT